MKERPIIFSGEMVRALLDGRKTQTRRVVKQPKRWQGQYDQLCTETLLDDSQVWWWDGVHGRVGASQPCPYGQPGDRLWVRETFRSRRVDGLPGDVTYKADHPGASTVPGSYGRSWKPSIHMPRWACRLLLEVTAVRVERLQNISEADALAEGIEHDSPHRAYFASDQGGPAFGTAVAAFRRLWESINGVGSWDANPWVWVIEFKRVEQEKQG